MTKSVHCAGWHHIQNGMTSYSECADITFKMWCHHMWCHHILNVMSALTCHHIPKRVTSAFEVRMSECYISVESSTLTQLQSDLYERRISSWKQSENYSNAQTQTVYRISITATYSNTRTATNIFLIWYLFGYNGPNRPIWKQGKIFSTSHSFKQTFFSITLI